MKQAWKFFAAIAQFINVFHKLALFSLTYLSPFFSFYGNLGVSSINFMNLINVMKIVGLMQVLYLLNHKYRENRENNFPLNQSIINIEINDYSNPTKMKKIIALRSIYYPYSIKMLKRKIIVC